MRACRAAIKQAPKATTATKRCARCERVGRVATRTAADFHEASDTKDGKRPHCKDCVRELRWISTGIVGMSVERFEHMLRDQGEKCAIPSCANRSTPERLLDVDHDHDTGQVRGLLCKSCNMVLGKSRESIAILRDMISYLEAR
jgi:hypothetical protein